MKNNERNAEQSKQAILLPNGIEVKVGGCIRVRTILGKAAAEAWKVLKVEAIVANQLFLIDEIGCQTQIRATYSKIKPAFNYEFNMMQGLNPTELKKLKKHFANESK